ncbi:MAG: DUF5106 domain-containing protein [Bacteroidales bacterium]|nr:DUF5106 domain-containing protein [Bacteroidales bacterium]
MAFRGGLGRRAAAFCGGLFLAGGLWACGGRAGSGQSVAGVGLPVAVADGPSARVDTAASVSASVSVPVDCLPELPMPEVPAALRTPAERAAFVLAHFWDGLDFTDTTRSRRLDFMEQYFVDFLSLFPYAEPSAAQAGVVALMRCAERDTDAYRLLAGLAEKYLYEPNSPMRQEDYLIWFLEEITRAPVLDALEKRRPAWLLSAARKNRPGMPAADFAYLTRDGRRQTLYGTPSAERLLLVFYDPLCEHCAEILGELQRTPSVTAAIRDGRLTVLAVYADADRAAWDSTKHRLPAGWQVGFDAPGDIQRHRLYALPAMPVFYLLDPAKTVLLKDASLPEIISHL